MEKATAMAKRKTENRDPLKTLHLGFRFPVALIRNIDAICNAEGITRTETIRRAISLYSKSKGIPAIETSPVLKGRPATVGK